MKMSGLGLTVAARSKLTSDLTTSMAASELLRSPTSTSTRTACKHHNNLWPFGIQVASWICRCKISSDQIGMRQGQRPQRLKFNVCLRIGVCASFTFFRFETQIGLALAPAVAPTFIKKQVRIPKRTHRSLNLVIRSLQKRNNTTSVGRSCCLRTHLATLL